jgi:hypothetical protein
VNEHQSTSTSSGPIQLSRTLGRVCFGPFPDAVPASWLDDDRPPAPDPNAVWDGVAWRVLDVASSMAELDRVRPCQGVAPGASRRLDQEPAIPWRLLDARLLGIEQRRGRAGERWLWAAGRSASETMHAVRQQTARAATITAHDLREPTWLRDEGLGLSPRELRLVVALVCAYEVGWGGLYDCQSTIATDLSLGSERTLRNLLWGTHWKRASGERVRRPGLVERGFVTAIQTYKPGRADGRPSDFDWLLLRIGPAIERAAAWTTLAKQWTPRAPRGTGWTRRVARAMAARLRSRVGRDRFDQAGAAWVRRSRSPIGELTSSTRPSSSSSSTPATSTRPSSSSSSSPATSTRPSSSSSSSPATSSSSSSSTPASPLVDLDEVAAALAKIGRTQAAPRVTADELAAARAECEDMRRDPKLAELAAIADQSFEVAAARRARKVANANGLNCPESVADNPATQGPPSGAPWDGVGGSGGSSSPAQGRPLEKSMPLARPEDFLPSSADSPGAVRPNPVDARPPFLAPRGSPAGESLRVGSCSPRHGASSLPDNQYPPGRVDELTQRVVARGGASADAVATIERTRETNPELAAALLALTAAWAGE